MSRIEAGPGDERTWGVVWHPDDPRAAVGPDCEFCGAACDVDDLCVDRCQPHACLDMEAEDRRFKTLLLEQLRLDRLPDSVSVGGILVFPDRHPDVQARLDYIDALTDALLDRIPCRAGRCVVDEIQQRPQDADIAADVGWFDLAMGIGELLDDRDALVKHMEQLRQRGDLATMEALRRTLDRAGMLNGPDDGLDEQETELSQRSTEVLDALVAAGNEEAAAVVRELMVRADVGAWVEPAPKSGTLKLIEGGRDAHG